MTLRLRVDLSDFVEGPNQMRWVLVKSETMETILDLVQHFKAKFDVKESREMSLFLDEPFILPLDESIKLLKDGDILKVKVRKLKKRKDKMDSEQDQVAVPPSKKPRKSNPEPPSPKKSVPEKIPIPSKKKKQVEPQPSSSSSSSSSESESEPEDVAKKVEVDKAGDKKPKRKRKRKRKNVNKNKLPASEMPVFPPVTSEPPSETSKTLKVNGSAKSMMTKPDKKPHNNLRGKFGNYGASKRTVFDEEMDTSAAPVVPDLEKSGQKDLEKTEEKKIPEPEPEPEPKTNETEITEKQERLSKLAGDWASPQPQSNGVKNNTQRPKTRPNLAPSCRKISCVDVLTGGQANGFQKLLGLSKSPLMAKRPQQIEPQESPGTTTQNPGSMGKERDLSPTEVLEVGSILRFRILEIGANLCPGPSEVKTGKVSEINIPNITLQMSLRNSHNFDPNDELIVNRMQLIEPKIVSDH